MKPHSHTALQGIALIVAGFVLAFSVFVEAAPSLNPPQNETNLTAYEMAERAVVDTLYYKFDGWFLKFKKRIQQVEGNPKTLPNEMELMRLYFYMAGLYAEMTHVLSITSKFKVEDVKEHFIQYSRKAKATAEGLLEQSGLSPQDRADALFFLGASEGYVGLVDYGEGHFFSALVNGLQADNHLEDALELDPEHADAHVGLGIYRYGNTRLGGLGNWIMQGGSDLRKVGLDHIERALHSKILSRPLAIKTLIWFYISEQINPANADLPPNAALSRETCRKRARELMDEYVDLYFKNVNDPDFIGNKGLKVMEAIQNVLDENYREAQEGFRQALEISDHLVKNKGFKLNPQYVQTVQAAMEFSALMQKSRSKSSASPPPNLCAEILSQIHFIEDGGSMIEYQSSKIRREIQDVFYGRLKQESAHHQCG